MSIRDIIGKEGNIFESTNKTYLYLHRAQIILHGILVLDIMSSVDVFGEILLLMEF